MIVTPGLVVQLTGPTIFLAGPVKGTWDWQSYAVNKLGRWAPEVNIAVPCQVNVLRKYLDRLAFGEFVIPQYTWETMYLNQAAQEGLILFWLEREVQHSCRRSYARTSRYELAEWKERYIRGECQIVLGIHPQFDGASYIRHRLAEEAPELKIYTSLKGVLRKAVALLGKPCVRGLAVCQ